MNSNAGTPENKKKSNITTSVRNFIIDLYLVAHFIKRIFRESFRIPLEFNEIIRQSYTIGVNSLPIISLTSFIIGIVFTKQSRPSLVEFGATSWLPSLVSIAIVRALAPLITALILAGKVGSYMGAELASMRVTEQIDAMEVSSTNPFKFLVVTRVIAVTLMLPLLVSYSAIIALAGGYLNIHHVELTTYKTFLQNGFSQITFLDLTSSFTKSIFYGFTIGVTGCYKGYHADMGTVGVGKAANSAVVISMFLIFLEEMVIVQVINYFRFL